MPKIRVLVVDDSVVVRQLLKDVLSSDPELDVVATAPNGHVALSKIRQLDPDLVTLDVEMPVMDGLQTMKVIQNDFSKLPVIMFSSLTQRGANATLEALALGAKDYVTKPSSMSNIASATQSIEDQLIPKIKALCSTQIQARKSARPRICKVSAPPQVAKRIDIVAIGVSTGGPNALEKIIPALPADLPVPIVIAQHMPPLFTKTLAERLSTLSQIPVCEGVSGDFLQPGGVWLAPGGKHMFLIRKITATQIQTDESSPVNFCRPSVDVLFRSISNLFGPRALAVVLTGMGDDGLRGCNEIHEAGGQVLVQDEASSVVWGMPGRVSMAGLADRILPLDDIASEINRRVRFGRLQTP